MQTERPSLPSARAAAAARGTVNSPAEGLHHGAVGQQRLGTGLRSHGMLGARLPAAGNPDRCPEANLALGGAKALHARAATHLADY